jgi:hypothetical protein
MSEMTPIVGHLYRVNVRAPLAHVEAVRRAHGDLGQQMLLVDVEHRLEALGFAAALAVLQDPTDPRLFSGVARWLGEPKGRPGLEVLAIEAVEEPPDPNADGHDAMPGVLDPGLTTDEIATVRRALGSDVNVRQLHGLADSLSPFYPAAASFLRAKASLLELREPANRAAIFGANAEAIAKLAGDVSRAYGIVADRVRAFAAPAHPPAGEMMASALRSCLPAGMRWPEVEAVFRRLSLSGSPPWARRSRLEGLREALEAKGAGFGHACAARMLAGMAPRSSDGRQLEALGWPLIRERTRGSSAIERAGDLLKAGGEAQSSRRAVADVLLARRQAELREFAKASRVGSGTIPFDVIADDVRRAAAVVVTDPTAALASDPVQGFARALVREIRDGIWLVAGGEACKPLLEGGREGFVSPTALQLVLASQKPVASGISQAGRLPEVLARLSSPDRSADPRQLLRAKHQMERAERAIERRRWVEWHRRDAELDALEGAK